MHETSKLRHRLLGLVLVTVAATSIGAEEVELLFEGTWTKGGYVIEGGWSIVEEDEGRFVVLDEDFKTRRAPDLKIFLSPLPLDELEDGNATSGSVLIAPLEQYEGAYRYAIGEDVEFEGYRSILIYCEEFSKYWGGSDLLAIAKPSVDSRR